MNDRALGLTLRSLAIAIALLAVIDPTLTRSRADRPTISVVAADTHADSAAATRIQKSLATEFVVVPGAFGGAAATVVLGDALPANRGDLARPVFALSQEGGARLSIERIVAPRRAGVESRIAVTTAVHVRGARGRTLNIELRSNGVAAAHASVPVTRADTVIDVPLALAVPSAGAFEVEVAAALTGAGADTARAAAMIDVVTAPLRVLFHDTRASWTSTFVRRAVERDSRFLVASRIGMTRTAVSDAGRPARLDDRAALDGYDAIVIGAPEALAENEVAAVERFMRRRGGSVVLLPDALTPGFVALGKRLLSAGDWRVRTGGVAEAIGRAQVDSASLRAIEMLWPLALPRGAEPIAFTNVTRTDSTRRAVVWGASVGAGHLVVSGALDAWRFRDAANSDFDRFWRELIAAEASRAPRAVEVSASPQVLVPGERSRIAVTLRDAAIAASAPAWEPARGIVRAELQRVGARDATPIQLWPDASVGTFTADLRAPLQEGNYVVRVFGGLRDTAMTPVMVHAGARRAKANTSGALAAFVSSTAGAVVSPSEISAALRRSIQPPSTPEPWNPMRNPWWIVPFALLLSAEWWMRRRKGKA